MIAFVRGRVASVLPEAAVVEVGGVGLLIACTPQTLAQLRVGHEAHLPTSMVVREDALTLYGFADDDERAVFDVLQTVSGIGPRIALGALATLRPDELRRAIGADDLARLTQIPGVGRKGAQRMALELKDRLGPLQSAAGVDITDGATTSYLGGHWREQVHTALTGLGWSTRDADTAVERVAEELATETASDGAPDDDSNVPALLRRALRSLDRG
jgi:Holliday junction DNA helicase RuvA